METLSGRITDPAYREELIAQSTGLEATLARAMANTYIAIEHIVLTATALGLGTCWVGALVEEGEIEKIFRLPDSMVVIAVLPVGYPAKVPPPRPRLSLEEILLRPL
jgi:nitroreductase